VMTTILIWEGREAGVEEARHQAPSVGVLGFGFAAIPV